MHRAVVLVSLLVLGSAWTLQGVHVLPETLTLTQEHFDLGRFMGQWYEVAVVSTCPHYMQRRRGNPVTVALELRHVTPEGNFTMMTTTYRNGSCQRTSTVYGLTTTPGQFFHHVARFGADVDSYVVQTNYDEFATMLMLSTEKSSGSKTTILKLFSRTVGMGPAVLDDFRALVRQHQMSDGAVIMNQNKGECVTGEPLTEPATLPQISVPKRSERNVVPSADSEGEMTGNKQRAVEIDLSAKVPGRSQIMTTVLLALISYGYGAIVILHFPIYEMLVMSKLICNVGGVQIK